MKSKIKLILSIIISGVLSLLINACDKPVREGPAPSVQPESRQIIDIIDGDTIILDGDEHVRLVGINTPEMNYGGTPEPCAIEATNFTDSLANGKDCYLVYNVSVGDSLDTYGRTLAFVHLLPDSCCLNVEICRAGWSEDWDSFPVRSDYEVLFEDAEDEAIAAGNGIWNQEENCD